jgi:transposase
MIFMRGYELKPEEWSRIKPLLPPETTGKKGRPRLDNQTMLNGMLWIVRSGAPWRCLPECYGKWQGVYARHQKWREDGLWDRITQELQDGGKADPKPLGEE